MTSSFKKIPMVAMVRESQGKQIKTERIREK